MFSHKDPRVMEEFTGYNIRLKRFKDGGFRIEMDVSENEYESIKDINSPKNDGVLFKVSIVPSVEV